MRINITKKTKELEQEVFFHLFTEFINNSFSGIRRKRDGSRLREGTVWNYVTLRNVMQQFCEKKNFRIRLFIDSNLTQREREKAAKYWLKFYTKFVAYLYNDRACFDNVVGFYIKNLKAFMNYLVNEKHIMVGTFHKLFYCEKQEIPIIVLSPEQLNYLIYDEELNKNIDDNLKKIRDIFVFGCTVALRISDLLALTGKNIFLKNNHYYLQQVKSKKTHTYTSILLPDYAVEILKRYYNKNSINKTLFPPMSFSRFNILLKRFSQCIPNNYEIKKIREKQGKQIVIYKDKASKTHFTLADMVTAHTMRRTAITNMLSLGMPENIVRKISGHAPLMSVGSLA